MYKILNQSSNSTEILLYSLIYGGYTANQIISALKASDTENITLRINSDGGEVFDAIAIYNYLKDKNVHVVIDGMCASAASVIAMSGKTITAKKGSMIMIHNPLTFAIGDSEYLRDQADILDKITASIAGIYSSRTGKSTEEIMSLMNAETWMTAEDALASGFVDEIEAPEPEPAPAPEPTNASTATYEDGVKAERTRLKMLDELYTPERAKILNRAKYETGETADQIALELLKSEPFRAARTDTMTLNNLPTATREQTDIDAMAEMMNALRR